jgi:hypothetical protein
VKAEKVASMPIDSNPEKVHRGGHHLETGQWEKDSFAGDKPIDKIPLIF